jgi:Zn-dependent M28 family amino/carboxypeptidase
MSRLHITPANQVRFGFWGAEELGLLGSEHYVATLTPEQRSDIAVNLNFDMLGSPNYVRFVYDGDGSTFAAKDKASAPPGSGAIEKVFTDYLGARNLAFEATEFDGRSDYAPFADVGIPVGGMYTGAEEIKTPEQATRYGGVAGQAYDQCYHQACDTVGNVNDTVLAESAGAVADSILHFAQQPTSPRPE